MKQCYFFKFFDHNANTCGMEIIKLLLLHAIDTYLMTLVWGAVVVKHLAQHFVNHLGIESHVSVSERVPRRHLQRGGHLSTEGPFCPSHLSRPIIWSAFFTAR